MPTENDTRAYRDFLNQNTTTEERLAVYPTILSPALKVVLVAMEEDEPLSMNELYRRFNQRFFGVDWWHWGCRDGLPCEPSKLWAYLNSDAMQKSGVISKRISYRGQRKLVDYALTDFGEDVAKPLTMQGARLIRELYEQNMRLFSESGLEPEDITKHGDYMRIPGFTWTSIPAILPMTGSLRKSNLFLEITKVLYEHRHAVLSLREVAGMAGEHTHKIKPVLRSLSQNGLIAFE